MSTRFTKRRQHDSCSSSLIIRTWHGSRDIEIVQIKSRAQVTKFKVPPPGPLKGTAKMSSNACRLTQLFNHYALNSRAANSFSLAISKRLQWMNSTDNLRKATFEFPLHQNDCHAFAMPMEGQTVHGGVIATVVEDTTTMHLSAGDSRGRKAVTTELNLSYLGVGKVGRTLQIESTILKVGGILGVAEAHVKDINSGKMVAVGRHTMMFIGEDGGAEQVRGSMNSVFDV